MGQMRKLPSRPLVSKVRKQGLAGKWEEGTEHILRRERWSRSARDALTLPSEAADKAELAYFSYASVKYVTIISIGQVEYN
jgi:hypothetical protein